jgi:hypothetical protein
VQDQQLKYKEMHVTIQRKTVVIHFNAMCRKISCRDCGINLLKLKLKFIKSSRIRWYGHVERMQNQRMPQQIATATI